jgi:hypothetical protein
LLKKRNQKLGNLSKAMSNSVSPMMMLFLNQIVLLEFSGKPLMFLQWQ